MSDLINSVLKSLDQANSTSNVFSEMDKSQPSPGRDIEQKSGPDKEAKPISPEKMNKDAVDMLNKAMSKETKKMDNC
jgi:hypothetical protein